MLKIDFISAFTPALNGAYPRYPDLPRPQRLLEMEDAFRNEKVEEKELRRAQERAAVDIIAEVVAAGIEVAGDGHVRWDDDASFLLSAMRGWERLVPSPHSENVRYRAVEPIRWVRPIMLDDFNFIRERAPIEIRPALTGPMTLALRADLGVYPDEGSLMMDLAAALNRELEGLEAAGARYLLVEEPLLTGRKDLKDAFFEAAEILCQNLTANVMLATWGGDVIGLEKELRDSPFAGIGLDLLDGENNEFLLSGSFDWGDKIIQLGLVSAANPEVEKAMSIAVQLVNYAQHFSPTRLWAAPNRGFEFLPREVIQQKMSSLAQGANWARREMARRGGG